MPPQQTQVELERARIRDLMRYYKPAFNKTHVPEAIPGQIDAENKPQPADPKLTLAPNTSIESDAPAAQPLVAGPDESRLLAHDPTLTALAQLGAFRLNCQRSIISLMDKENQYILAEATRTVSLHSPLQCEPGDEIYLGPRTLDMVWGVCPNTLQVFTALDNSTDVSTSLVTANKDCYVMNDLSAIEAYKSRPYVAGWPYMKFYAEVPIHSPSGYVIGTYCVVDDRPRDGLDKKGLAAMNEISSAIMKHLELVQSQAALKRADEMLKSLGMFIEKEAIYDDPSSHEFQASELRRASPRPIGTVETMSTRSEGRRGSEIVKYSEQTPMTSVSSPPPQLPASKSTNELSTVAEEPILATPGTIDQAMKASASPRPEMNKRQLSMNQSQAMTEPIAATNTRELFSRACFRIKRALGLDGVIFVDACSQDVNNNASTVPDKSSTTSSQAPTHSDALSSSLTEWTGSEHTSHSVSDQNRDSSKAATSSRRRATIDLLGHSGPDTSAQEAFFSAGQIPLPRSTLRALLRKFRHGHVFVFDEDGVLVRYAPGVGVRKGESKEESDRADVEYEKEKQWADQLLKICPDAKSIIFFPLWDTYRDQWFAGALAWTTDYARVIRSSDVTYLAAFAACIMSEKSKIDVMTSDREKLDFISSVSHELRSPLHGVLASTEALQELSTGLLQDELIRTITVCGEILLDTMDHILDYARTTNPQGSTVPNHGKTLLSKGMKPTNFDFCELVESVIEGCFFGHDYRRSTFSTFDTTEAADNDASASSALNKLTMILTVNWETSWIFRSQVGGWTRILMNIFGNSLKYTDAGFVHVALETTASPTTKHPDRKAITLRIEDSGKGISNDYMKYHLYTPFNQEDHMATGTGLGLSIVRELVAELGGTIDFRSEVTHGTSVNVTIPVKEPSDSVQLGETDGITLINEVRDHCTGLTLCLIDFDFYPDMDEEPTGILSPYARCMLALKQSLTTMITDWFGMKVTTCSNLDDAKGDVLLGFRSKLGLSDGHQSEQPLIIFEDTTVKRLLDTVGVHYLSMPAGPHKFARVLRLALLGQDSGFTTKSTTTRTPTLGQNTTEPTRDSHEQGSSADPSFDNPLPESGYFKSSLPLNTLSMRLKETDGNSNAISPSDATMILATPTRNKVLLVEDNSVNMKILMHYMKSARQEFFTAHDGLEALQKYQAAPTSFKVIFMDLSMPIMDGLTSTRHIRAYELEHAIPRTRIVALTCFSSEKYQRDAAHSGVDVYLIKPVPMKQLKPILALDPETFERISPGGDGYENGVGTPLRVGTPGRQEAIPTAGLGK